MATTTYHLISGSEANCSVTPAISSDGNFQITPGAAAATWSFDYEIYCDGVASGARAAVSGTVATANPVAVDDTVAGAKQAGVAFATSVAGNDTVCPSGVTSYVLKAGTLANCTVSPNTSTTGSFNVTPTDAKVANWSFDYEIYCNGAATGEIATVAGTVAPPLPVAVNDTDTTVRTPGVAFNSQVQTNDTACSTGATTYVYKAGSAVNCTVSGSPSSTGTFSVTVTGTGQWSYDYEIYCGGQPSGQVAKVTGSASTNVTADAVNNTVTGTVAAKAATVDVSLNDVKCSSGATTFRLRTGTLTNVSVDPNQSTTAGTFAFTPTAAGAWSFQYDLLCDGVVIDTATVDGTATAAGAPTADAVDDVVTGSSPGKAVTVTVGNNDTTCSAGATTTYQLKAGSPTNVTVNETSDGVFSATPTAAGAWSFQYDILCNGTVTDTATVSGNAASGPVATNDTDTTKRAPGTAVSISVSANDTPCPTGTTSYRLVAGSEANCTVGGSPSSNGSFNVTPGSADCAWSFKYEIYCDGVASGKQATVTGSITGSVVGPNLFANPDFSKGVNPTAQPTGGPIATDWSTGASYEQGTYNPDTGVAIIDTGGQLWQGPQPYVDAIPFPGDPANNVAATNWFLFGNGNASGAPFLWAEGTVRGLTVGDTYRIAYYVQDATSPNNPYACDASGLGQPRLNDPDIRTVVNGKTVEQLFAVPNLCDDGLVHKWHRHEVTFTADAATATIQLWDDSIGIYGDDWAMTQFFVQKITTC